MAQKVEVRLIDDLDGGEAAETICFALDGKAYEIDLSDDNASKLRQMIEPYRVKARAAGTASLRAKGVTLPPARRMVTVKPDNSAQIRDWAKAHGLPVNDRGRVSGPVRDAHEAFEKGDQGPLNALLDKHNIEPEAAKAAAKTILTEPAAPEPPRVMTSADRERLAAKQAGRLSNAQLTRLRRSFADPHGHGISDGRSSDTTSYEALASRGLMKKIQENLYEITPVGRLWFDVQGISPEG